MLRAIDTDLWVAEQPLKYFGLEVGTRMTVIRLEQDRLMVISPIRPDTATLAQLNQLGKVSYIVAPNLYHHLFLTPFKRLYSEAELWATAALKHKRPDLAIDRVLSDSAAEGVPELALQLLEGIEAVPVSGFKTLDLKGAVALDEWVFFHPKSQTLILTDLAFHFDRTSSPSARLAASLLGGYEQLRPSLLEKIATVDKAQVKQSIQAILTWDFQRVIMAHGSIVEQAAKQQFQLGYEWFLGQSLS
uniref:DUF4336 domain-containing protein n=1 Tax=Cyanothece sp. (strain PCC 7425 / ATCC 29141) TaxID=395961 RepID=B8HS76_CYAP4